MHSLLRRLEELEELLLLLWMKTCLMRTWMTLKMN